MLSEVSSDSRSQPTHLLPLVSSHLLSDKQKMEENLLNVYRGMKKQNTAKKEVAKLFGASSKCVLLVQLACA